MRDIKHRIDQQKQDLALNIDFARHFNPGHNRLLDLVEAFHRTQHRLLHERSNFSSRKCLHLLLVLV